MMALTTTHNSGERTNIPRLSSASMSRRICAGAVGTIAVSRFPPRCSISRCCERIEEQNTCAVIDRIRLDERPPSVVRSTPGFSLSVPELVRLQRMGRSWVAPARRARSNASSTAWLSVSPTGRLCPGMSARRRLRRHSPRSVRAWVRAASVIALARFSVRYSVQCASTGAVCRASTARSETVEQFLCSSLSNSSS